MGQRCEVCASFRPEGDVALNRKLFEVPFAGRSVLLCSGHAQIALNSNVTTVEELRELYRESAGNRSFVPRRAPSVLPGRMSGRRATDH